MFFLAVFFLRSPTEREVVSFLCWFLYFLCLLKDLVSSPRLFSSTIFTIVSRWCFLMLGSIRLVKKIALLCYLVLSYKTRWFSSKRKCNKVENRKRYCRFYLCIRKLNCARRIASSIAASCCTVCNTIVHSRLANLFSLPASLKILVCCCNYN